MQFRKQAEGAGGFQLPHFEERVFRWVGYKGRFLSFHEIQQATFLIAIACDCLVFFLLLWANVARYLA